MVRGRNNHLNIILVRHYKVDIGHSKKVDSKTYDRYCNEYNERDVIDQLPPELPKYKLYASTMSRAQTTAKLATGREPEILEGVYEPTFRSYKNSSKKIPFWFWETRARIQWLFNNKRQDEIRFDTYRRLEASSDKIIERGEDCIIVMHSFVMRIFSRILIKKGFKGKKIMMAKNGESYWYTR